MDVKEIRYSMVKLIYADHNRSRIVRNKIRACLSSIKPDEFGLNLGAGSTDFGPNVRNLDIFEGENVHYVASAESIPEVSDFFSVVISQEVLEHVRSPHKALSEVYRVLKTGGTFYCQVPFIIGYHPGPTDFWRFTKEGIVEAVTAHGFKVQEVGITVGSATGFYRISVEFFSVLLSLAWRRLYIPFKGLFSLLFYPIKFLDKIMIYSNQNDRLAGGYYVIAKK